MPKWLKKLGLFLMALAEAIYRDLLGLYLLIKTENRLAQMIKNEEVLHDIFRSLVRKNPNKPCIVFNSHIWTFQDVSCVPIELKMHCLKRNVASLAN